MKANEFDLCAVTNEDLKLLDRALNQPPVKLKKQRPLFTKAEIIQILALIHFATLEGSYIGIHDQYIKRNESIKQKLNNQLKERI